MIGVLREQGDRTNNGNFEKANNNNIKKNIVGDCHCRISQEVPSKISAMDVSGILNCRRRLEWTKDWLRKNQHEFLNKENLRKDLMLRSNEKYHLNYFFKITDRQFRHLVNILEPEVTGLKPQRKRKAFSAEERIAITLKYLATGEVNSCRNYCFLASKPVIIKMIADICQKMYELLKEQYVTLPKRSEQWIPIINGMQQKHHLSNCLGHLILKEIMFHKPRQNSSRVRGLLWNESAADKKGMKSPPLILTSIIDDGYNFLYVDVEKTKAEFFDEIFEKSKIRKLIEDNSIPIPASIRKANGNCEACSFAGCIGFPEKPYLKSMRASPMEFDTLMREGNDALRILCNIFPVLCQPLRLCEADAEKIILGSVALYNFLRKSDSDYCKFTESRVLGTDEEWENFEDEDCVIVENDEERKERYELTPSSQYAMCFSALRKPQPDFEDILAGLEYRKKQTPNPTEDSSK